MGVAILFPKHNAFDGPIRYKMAAQCPLPSISRSLVLTTGWIYHFLYATLYHQRSINSERKTHTLTLVNL